MTGPKKIFVPVVFSKEYGEPIPENNGRLSHMFLTEGFFYAYEVYFLDSERLGCFIKDKRAQFTSPAEATRAAVKYCLENLI